MKNPFVQTKFFWVVRKLLISCSGVCGIGIDEWFWIIILIQNDRFPWLINSAANSGIIILTLLSFPYFKLKAMSMFDQHCSRLQVAACMRGLSNLWRNTQKGQRQQQSPSHSIRLICMQIYEWFRALLLFYYQNIVCAHVELNPKNRWNMHTKF